MTSSSLSLIRTSIHSSSTTTWTVRYPTQVKNCPRPILPWPSETRKPRKESWGSCSSCNELQTSDSRTKTYRTFKFYANTSLKWWAISSPRGCSHSFQASRLLVCNRWLSCFQESRRSTWSSSSESFWHSSTERSTYSKTRSCGSTWTDTWG